MGRPQQTATNSGHTDGNQSFSIIGVIGTLGTADTQGTASTLPFGVDPYNGGIYTSPLIPLPNTPQNNPELHLSYYASGLLGTVQKIINATTYTKLLIYDSNNILGTVTAWV